MKCLIALLLLAGCCDHAAITRITPKNVVEGRLNYYELIEIGNYTCVSANLHSNPGGLWCERKQP